MRDMTTRISSKVVMNAYQLRSLLSEAAEETGRCSILSKLIWGAMKDFDEKMPDGVDCLELLLAADIISSWAVRELARESSLDERVLMQSFVFAQAMRCGLLPGEPKKEQEKEASRDN